VSQLFFVSLVFVDDPEIESNFARTTVSFIFEYGGILFRGKTPMRAKRFVNCAALPRIKKLSETALRDNNDF
jgi:hypothetical protein